VAGNYNGGTLNWYKFDYPTLSYSSGTDPDFRAKVEYIEPEKIKLTIITASPIPSIKIFDFKLALRN
jgi:hypothetical protein